MLSDCKLHLTCGQAEDCSAPIFKLCSHSSLRQEKLLCASCISSLNRSWNAASIELDPAIGDDKLQNVINFFGPARKRLEDVKMKNAQH